LELFLTKLTKKWPFNWYSILSIVQQSGAYPTSVFVRLAMLRENFLNSFAEWKSLLNISEPKVPYFEQKDP